MLGPPLSPRGAVPGMSFGLVPAAEVKSSVAAGAKPHAWRLMRVQARVWRVSHKKAAFPGVSDTLGDFGRSKIAPLMSLLTCRREGAGPTGLLGLLRFFSFLLPSQIVVLRTAPSSLGAQREGIGIKPNTQPAGCCHFLNARRVPAVCPSVCPSHASVVAPMQCCILDVPA